LIGAPPGYVGYEESGQLTESVRRKPYSVILLDEIEKAHPDVFNILLQVLDEGRLTDNKGRTADFKNTIIIMTSNMGSSLIQENFEMMNEGNHDEILERTQNEVTSLLKKTIRPEFLNRVDEIIMFKPLNLDEIIDVVKIQVRHAQDMLSENGIMLSLTDDAVIWVARIGFDPQYGARPLKRAIQRYILNQISKEILAGKIARDSHIRIDVKNDGLVFENE
jgi:ATP-dependent Clp protease ATP-binding subunit ClpB